MKKISSMNFQDCSKQGKKSVKMSNYYYCVIDNSSQKILINKSAKFLFGRWPIQGIYSIKNSILITLTYSKKLFINGIDSQEVKKFNLPGFPSAIQFSQDENSLIVGTLSGCIFTLNIKSGKVSPIESGHQGPVKRAVISPNGLFIASTGSYGKILLWEPFKNHHPKYLMDPQTRNFMGESIKFIGNNEIAVGCTDGFVRFFNRKSGDIINKILVDKVMGVGELKLINDNKIMITSNNDKTLIWEKNKQWKPLHSISNLHGFSLAISPDQKSFASCTDYQPQTPIDLKIFNTKEGKLVEKFFPIDEFFREGFGPISRMVYSPTNNHLACSLFDKVFIVGLEKKKVLFTLQSSCTPIARLAYSPDGNFIVVCGRKNYLELWNAKNGKLVKHIFGHEFDVNDLCFSKDGKYLISCSDDTTVIMWDFLKIVKSITN